MKRLLCVALVLLVGVVPMAAVANQECVPVEHLLWDIPFGIGVEECIALVKEKTGVVLTYEYTDNPINASYPSDVYTAKVERGITFSGHPVELYALFHGTEGGLLDFGLVFYDWEKWDVSLPEGEDGALQNEDFVTVFHEVMDIYHEIGDLYGTPTGGGMLISEKLFGPTRSYSFPMRNGVLDEALVQEIFTGFVEYCASVTLFVHYDNVQIYVSVISLRSWETQRTYSISLLFGTMEEFNREDAYSFEGRDGEYSYRELGEDDKKQ